MDDKIIWEVRSLNNTVALNIGNYTCIIDDHDEHEEELLANINSYFQKRTNTSITIKDNLNSEIVSYKDYTSFLIDHNAIDEEHKLSANGLLNKKLQRDLLNSIETDGYINSINILMEDFLKLLEKDMPLKVKRFDHKQFIKQLTFEYDYSVDYSRLINRLFEILPLLIDEMNTQSNNRTLLIYLYPESNLSPKEQTQLNNLLRDLDVAILVLTDSPIFFSDTLETMNYLRFGKQVITSELISDMYWDSPLDYNRESIKWSLKKILENYSNKFELEPTISNHDISEIILFNALDIYVCCYFLKRCKLPFKLNLSADILPPSLNEYLGISMKMM